MKTYVLLFRGINVGGKNKLPMKDLSSLLGGMGYRDVRTYIQSGNVVLRGDERPGGAVERRIESQFGFAPDLMVLDKGEFEKALNGNPYEAGEGREIQFYFAGRPPEPDRERMASLAAPTERFELKGKVFYLHAPEGIGRSRLVAGLERCLGAPATGRNLNTVRKIAEMLENG